MLPICPPQHLCLSHQILITGPPNKSTNCLPTPLLVFISSHSSQPQTYDLYIVNTCRHGHKPQKNFPSYINVQPNLLLYFHFFKHVKFHRRVYVTSKLLPLSPFIKPFPYIKVRDSLHAHHSTTTKYIIHTFRNS